VYAFDEKHAKLLFKLRYFCTIDNIEDYLEYDFVLYKKYTNRLFRAKCDRHCYITNNVRCVFPAIVIRTGQNIIEMSGRYRNCRFDNISQRFVEEPLPFIDSYRILYEYVSFTKAIDDRIINVNDKDLKKWYSNCKKEKRKVGFKWLIRRG
jgi:hypothetical protein